MPAFNFKRLVSDIKKHYVLFDHILFCDKPTDKRYPSYRTMGILTYSDRYGFWPVFNYDLWKGKKKETLYFRYTFIAEPLKKYQTWIYGNPGNWRNAGYKNPYFFKPGSPPTSKYTCLFAATEIEYANDLVLKILYKKNLNMVLRIYNALSKLWPISDDLLKTKRILSKFDRERRVLKMGKKGGNGKNGENELIDIPPLKKQSTGYIRKIVIEELDLLRSGKVSMRRSRIVSSLASRVLESMHLDLESQFLYLKEEAKNLKMLPTSIDETMQE